MCLYSNSNSKQGRIPFYIIIRLKLHGYLRKDFLFLLTLSLILFFSFFYFLSFSFSLIHEFVRPFSRLLLENEMARDSLKSCTSFARLDFLRKRRIFPTLFFAFLRFERFNEKKTKKRIVFFFYDVFLGNSCQEVGHK